MSKNTIIIIGRICSSGIEWNENHPLLFLSWKTLLEKNENTAEVAKFIVDKVASSEQLEIEIRSLDKERECGK